MKSIPSPKMSGNQFYDLCTPTSVEAPASPGSDCGSESSINSYETLSPESSIFLGHYNPTENWMLWTNRSYSPQRLHGRIRQYLRGTRTDSYFGY